ncbi:MAG: hypothetical protein QOD96_1262, partial [Pseudonocardiales bacterium]|nr:hypothetical protein [Pseudonocardiales bacterium]
MVAITTIAPHRLARTVSMVSPPGATLP